MKLRIRDIAAYTLLPRFIPRIGELLPNLAFFASLMAAIFANVRLLPSGHPYLRAATYGSYGIRDVLAAAAANLQGGIRNSDQYLVFGIFLLGSVLLILQFTLLVVFAGIAGAQAAIPFVGLFQTVNPETDVAFLMLDRVIGIPGYFGSCFDPAVNAPLAATVCKGYIAPTSFPTAFHLAQQELFSFFSNGILIVALLMVVFYVFTLLVETAATGVPFGKRFQSVYSPMRLVLAIMLLVPIGHGYNSGQYLTLIAAKWGSSFATNGWLVFNNRTNGNPLGLTSKNLVGEPKIQEMSSIINFFYVAHACRAAYKIAHETDIQPYLILSASSTAPTSSAVVTNATSFIDAMNYYGKRDIVISIGEKNVALYKKYPGFVNPYCGQITLPIHSNNTGNIPNIYEVHFDFIKTLWFNADFRAYGTRMAYIVKFLDQLGGGALPGTAAPWGAADKAPAGTDFYIQTRVNMQAMFNANMQAKLDDVRNNSGAALAMNSQILYAGWGGAGLWFNNLTTFNGALTDALFITPTPTKYPSVMEFVANKKKGFEKDGDYKTRFSPSAGSSKNGRAMTINDFAVGEGLIDASGDILIASLLDTVYQAVANSEVASRPVPQSGGNAIKSFVNFIFGDTGLFDLRKNDDVFPLARMAMMGRSIIDKTITTLAAGGLMMGMGGIIGGLNNAIGGSLSAIGSTFLDFALAGLTVGFILYYIIPLLPFMYFFFAVGRWVKSIFEAMVAVPLWALAHLRLGGDGIVGPAASQGYIQILEIFLRPILTLFGLLATLSVFYGLSSILDTTFNLVVFNAGGFDMSSLSSLPPGSTVTEWAREALDELFYTILYAIVLYMMALSCFKLIDLIPSKVMRYLGTSAQAFSDNTEGFAEKLIQYTAYGGHEMTDEIKGVIGGAAGGVGKVGGSVMSGLDSSRMIQKLSTAPK